MENVLRSLLKKPHTLTLTLSPQGRGDLIIAPPLRGGCLNVALFMNVLINWKIQNTELMFLQFAIFIVKDKHV